MSISKEEFDKAIKEIHSVLHYLQENISFNQEDKQDFYSRGQKIKIEGYYSKYIIAKVDKINCCLICLESGNRFNDPTYVHDYEKITKDEMLKMSGGYNFVVLAE